MGRPNLFTEFIYKDILVRHNVCTHCGHTWVPRKTNKACPKCYRIRKVDN